MDAKNTNVKPWPKQGLSDHVRAAPEPVEPRPSWRSTLLGLVRSALTSGSSPSSAAIPNESPTA